MPWPVFALIRQVLDPSCILLDEFIAGWLRRRVDHDHLGRVVESGERLEAALEVLRSVVCAHDDAQPRARHREPP